MTNDGNWKCINELPPALLERQQTKIHGFNLGSRKMVVAYTGGTWHAFPARCPHSGGPLQQGWIEEGAIVCPWHRFAFDIETGTCRNAGYGLKQYEVKIESGKVWVAVPKRKWWEF